MKTGDTVEFKGGPYTFKDLGVPHQRIVIVDGDRGILGLQKYPTAWEVHVSGAIILADEMYFSLVPPATFTFQTDAVPVAEPVPAKVDKLCDCSINQLLHGGCKCGGR